MEDKQGEILYLRKLQNFLIFFAQWRCLVKTVPPHYGQFTAMPPEGTLLWILNSFYLVLSYSAYIKANGICTLTHRLVRSYIFVCTFRSVLCCLYCIWPSITHEVFLPWIIPCSWYLWYDDTIRLMNTFACGYRLCSLCVTLCSCILDCTLCWTPSLLLPVLFVTVGLVLQCGSSRVLWSAHWTFIPRSAEHSPGQSVLSTLQQWIK